MAVHGSPPAFTARMSRNGVPYGGILLTAVVTLIGALLMAVGVVLTVLPGPAILFFIAGFAVLGSEYDWAQDALQWTKEKYQQARQKLKQRRSKSSYER